jgi:hypothetical protein
MRLGFWIAATLMVILFFALAPAARSQIVLKRNVTELRVPCVAHNARRDDAKTLHVFCPNQPANRPWEEFTADVCACPVARVENDGRGNLKITCAPTKAALDAP